MLPNLLTVFRLLLVPVILWLAYGRSAPALSAGLGLLVVAGVTDWLDGYLARRRDQVTPFGTLMDPLTDKMLVLGLLFVFADRGLVPMWLVLVLLFREMLVSGVRRVKAARGEVVGANWMGKTKFVLQNVLLGGIFLYLILEARGMRVPGGQALVFWCALAVVAASAAFALVFFVRHAPGLLRAEEAGTTTQRE